MKLKTLTCLSLITCVASLATAAHAQTFSVIHAFTGGSDGAHPYAGVTIRGGDLYGTTNNGGFSEQGTVYQAKRLPGDNRSLVQWSIVPLSLLPISGDTPWSRVLFGPDGRLYGTTLSGGGAGDGNVYSLTPPLSICKTAFCPWQETELHDFSGTDGSQPAYGDLTWDQQGNIYGTTYTGGQEDRGTVFEMMPSGNGWTTVPIYKFSGPDGTQPQAGVVIDSKGNLFGTTLRGGGGGDYGVVYELKYVLGVGWQETVLYYFANGDDGAYPGGGLIFDSSGNLYGTATGGSGHGGTVFELSPSGDTWSFNLLYSIPAPPNGVCGSSASLTFDTAGNLYGTTVCYPEGGTVFKLAKTGNGWAYTELHSFDPLLDGDEPMGSVAVDTDGTLYGTAAVDGPTANGTLWMIKQ
jgi:uncharacterized repeat protein (TIGR03803 family)